MPVSMLVSVSVLMLVSVSVLMLVSVSVLMLVFMFIDPYLLRRSQREPALPAILSGPHPMPQGTAASCYLRSETRPKKGRNDLPAGQRTRRQRQI
jgi:hypothetical protein